MVQLINGALANNLGFEIPADPIAALTCHLTRIMAAKMLNGMSGFLIPRVNLMSFQFQQYHLYSGISVSKTLN